MELAPVRVTRPELFAFGRTTRQCVSCLMMVCRMILKSFPKDVEIGELVEMTMTMTQTTLLRVYEIVEVERRALNESERRSLDAMAHVFNLAKSDMRKMKKKRLN